VLAACLAACASGCSLFETGSASATQPSALSSLTNWFSQPIEMAPGFDLESIKPEPRSTALISGNLLEVTIWDLYEPGKPYTFPVRVSSRQTIEVPFLGEVPVDNRGLPEVEDLLTGGLRNGEYLLNPRILVRSLDSPVIKVQVTGAVNRSGFAEVSRTDSSVYAVLTSAGGLKKTASPQVGVTRRAGMDAAGPPYAATQAAPGEDGAARASPATPGPGEQRPAELRANSSDELSVAAAQPDEIAGALNQSPSRVIDADRNGDIRNRARQHVLPGSVENATVWYDASQPTDRERLKALQLEEGDVVTIKSAAQPLRIGGIVNRPGAYPLPAGRSLNVWQAVDLAGGVRDENVPLNITLTRPAAEGRVAQRWSLHVASLEQHPVASPSVEPGDVLHVEPTAGSRIRRAVGDLWNKP